MTEPEVAPPSRRRSNQRQRHRRLVRKRIFMGIAIAIVVVIVALWFSDTIRFPTDHPSFASSVQPLKSNQASTEPGAPVGPTRHALTPQDPMRLWIGGDSLAGALGPALGEMTAASGVVQPEYEFHQGSGLMSGDDDWFDRATEAMQQVDPETVVFVIGTNDAVVYTDRDAEKYEQLTEKMMQTLVGDGRDVYWVNAPVMRDDDVEENVKKIDEIQRAVAARTEHVTFVDVHTLFADEAGDYVSSLPDENGDEVTMRAGDGIHLTGEGAKHLGREIFDQIDAVWRITPQAVPGQAKDVRVSDASDSEYGGGSGSGSGSGNGSSSRNWSSDDSSDGTSSGTTVTTATPITTAPPAMVPPTTPATTPPPSGTTPTSSP